MGFGVTDTVGEGESRSESERCGYCRDRHLELDWATGHWLLHMHPTNSMFVYVAIKERIERAATLDTNIMSYIIYGYG